MLTSVLRPDLGKFAWISLLGERNQSICRRFLLRSTFSAVAGENFNNTSCKNKVDKLDIKEKILELKIYGIKFF